MLVMLKKGPSPFVPFDQAPSPFVPLEQNGIKSFHEGQYCGDCSNICKYEENGKVANKRKATWRRIFGKKRAKFKVENKKTERIKVRMKTEKRDANISKKHLAKKPEGTGKRMTLQFR